MKYKKTRINLSLGENGTYRPQSGQPVLSHSCTLLFFLEVGMIVMIVRSYFTGSFL